MVTQCDLVMKGGITSGVVYPKLVAKLSSKYRFKNIGGTSAGAIAAGACAAAEYGRQHGRPDAFDLLARLPDELSAKITPAGHTRLLTLFQPTPSLRRHFAVMAGALNAQPRDAVPAVAAGLMLMHWGLVLFALLSGSLLLWPFVEAVAPDSGQLGSAIVAAVAMVLVAVFAALLFRDVAHGGAPRAAAELAGLLLLMGLLLHWAAGSGPVLHLVGAAVGMTVVALMVMTLLLISVAVLFARGLLAGLHANGYGLCSGQTAPDGDPQRPALTDWLTAYLNDLAGMKPDADPLTFGHLWGSADPAAPRGINLEVMTSAVSQQMVYSIPFRPGAPCFYYDPDEWAKLFPAHVMRFLDKVQRANPQGEGSEGLPEGASVTSREGKLLRRLPRHADLPIVVAVRMSLSFPILLSAVPLYAVDWSLKKLRADPAPNERDALPIVATRVWFSDGGIGSNMPLHMFDALLPGHPTFAVNLKSPHPDFPIQSPDVPDNNGGRIYLPSKNSAGHVRYWPDPKDQAPLGGLIGFLAGIVNTMQNWRDEILFPYPGFRDRIVQISQKPDEGGLNLDMPEANIKALARAGEMAAERLIARFHPEGDQGGNGWANHQEVRLRTFLGTMQPGCAALLPSLKSGVWSSHVTSTDGYNQAERNLAHQFLQGIVELGALGQNPELSLENGALKPLSQIRTTPRI